MKLVVGSKQGAFYFVQSLVFILLMMLEANLLADGGKKVGGRQYSRTMLLLLRTGVVVVNSCSCE